MENNFNFLSQPIESALLDSAHLLPGLDQVELLHLDELKGKLSLKRVKCHAAAVTIKEQELESESLVLYQNFRMKNKNSNWYDTAELPFYSNKTNRVSQNIFDEVLKSVLCIGFYNETDGANDLFIFYFKKDASEFGPMQQGKVLETTQKIVIERLLRSSLSAILQSYRQNRQAMVAYNQRIQSLLNSQKQQLERARKDLASVNKQMDAIIMSILNDIKSVGDIVRFTDDAKELLRKHIHDLPLLKKCIKQAFGFAKTISFGLIGEEIIIEKEYFSDLNSLIIEERENEDVKKKPDSYSIHTKTYRFLDSLENAAQKLNARGMKLTSSMVGSMLEHPVTAAAISDKLKNHSKKVNLLLQQYPDNWKTIRYKFRPIVNIQERNADSDVA